MDERRQQCIERLKVYFRKHDDIVMAFVFGSQAKGYARKSSDWDIGVYFKPPPGKALELETGREYPMRHEIWSDAERIVGASVDLVVLNRVAASLVFSILNRGIPLVIKDYSLYSRIISVTHYEAVDFWQFTRDFLRIRERSRSLSPEDRSNLIKHIVFLENELQDIGYFQTVAQQQFINDRVVRRNAERWVENLVMGALEVAKIALAAEKKDVPDSYRETLRALGFLYFDEAFANTFADFAELRNLVAHEYLDLRWQQIQKFIAQAKDFYPRFLIRIKGIVEE